MNCPYMKKEVLAQAFGISKSTVHIRSVEMEEKARGRYGPYAVVRDGQVVLVNCLALLDWMKYRKRLLDGRQAKHVPDYDPEKIARGMGWEVTQISLRRPKV